MFVTILQFSEEKEIKLKEKGRGLKSNAYKGYVRSNTNQTDTVGKSLSDPTFRNFFKLQRQA